MSGTAEYLIPSTETGVHTLSSPDDSVSSSVSDVATSAIYRIVGITSGACTLEIERSLTSGGPFFHYRTETLDDEDLDRWVRLQAGIYPYFRLTATNTESSDPIQVKFFGYAQATYKYCTPVEIRDMTKLTYAELEDDEIMQIIDNAVPIINKDIAELIEEEEISNIDTRRSNTIDGSNTTFYVDLDGGWFFGDLDDNGEVDVDDIVVYEYTNDNQKVLCTISSITTSGVDKGKFVVSSAPSSGSTLNINYRKQRVPADDERLSLATQYLSSAMAMSAIDPNDFSSIQIGGLKAVMGRGKKKAQSFLQNYHDLIMSIDDTLVTRVPSNIGYESIDFEDI